MQKWEYKVEQVFNVWDSQWRLNNAGDEGWELVGIYREDGSFYAVFKRPSKY